MPRTPRSWRAPPVWFITGTGTGVGKTVLTALLTRHLRAEGRGVVALKPLSSGGRDDARVLWEAADRRLSIAEVNPWAFRAPLSPAIAAEREGRRVFLADITHHVARWVEGHDLVLVEGAGGVLSPLGVGFDARDVIRGLGAMPVVVGANRLGAVNAVLLTLEALPGRAKSAARVVLMNPARPNLVSRTNAAFLRRRLGARGLVEFPFVGGWRARLAGGLPRRLVVPLRRLVASV